MSLSIPLKSSDIDPFDEDARRQWMSNYLKAAGIYRESSQEAKYDRCVEEVAQHISDHDKVTRVGYLYFEFHVDKAMWQDAFNDSDMAPEWPWSHSPNLNDMSQGLSHMYRQWRIDYNLPIDLAEPIAPVPTCMVPQLSPAKREEIWDVIYGDKPYSEVVVGPFEVTLLADLDFHRLFLGEGNKLYDSLCRLIGPVLVITWTIVDNKASSLIIGVNPMFHVDKESLNIILGVRRVWLRVLKWLKAVKQGHWVTLVDNLENFFTAMLSPAQSDDFDV